MLESEMAHDGYNYLKGQRKYKEIKQEVPFLSRCIDLVLINDADEIISIEFKISKWRHAIEQARNHKLGADRSYVCMPKRRITPALSQALASSGIGLLLYDSESVNRIYEAIPADNHKESVSAFRKLLLQSFDQVQ